MMAYKDTDLTIDLRLIRAQQITAMIINIIAKYVTNEEGDFLRRAHNDLLDAFHREGAEIVTDYTRAENGLPPRGDKGWTQAELQAMEARRLEMLMRPTPPIILTGTANQVHMGTIK